MPCTLDVNQKKNSKWIDLAKKGLFFSKCSFERGCASSRYTIQQFTIHDPTIHDPTMHDSCINYANMPALYKDKRDIKEVKICKYLVS